MSGQKTNSTLGDTHYDFPVVFLHEKSNDILRWKPKVSKQKYAHISKIQKFLYSHFASGPCKNDQDTGAS